MIQAIIDWKLDIWGLTETNILWHTVNTNHKWSDRMRHLSPHRSIFAYNRHEKTGNAQFLPGGVGQVITSQLAG